MVAHILANEGLKKSTEEIWIENYLDFLHNVNTKSCNL